MTDGENIGTCSICEEAPRLLTLDDYNELACPDCLVKDGRDVHGTRAVRHSGKLWGVPEDWSDAIQGTTS